LVSDLVYMPFDGECQRVSEFIACKESELSLLMQLCLAAAVSSTSHHEDDDHVAVSEPICASASRKGMAVVESAVPSPPQEPVDADDFVIVGPKSTEGR